jgi:hypothetical protein
MKNFLPPKGDPGGFLYTINNIKNLVRFYSVSFARNMHLVLGGYRGGRARIFGSFPPFFPESFCPDIHGPLRFFLFFIR